MMDFVDYVCGGTKAKAAEFLDMPWSTVRDRYNGKNGGQIPAEKIPRAVFVAEKERPRGTFSLRNALPITDAEWQQMKGINFGEN